MQVDSAGEVIQLSARDKVSPHFTAGEFSTNEHPYPPRHFDRLARIAGILERCRAVTGRPLKITSGWRDPEANAGAGGAKRSQHMSGRAVDFRDYRADNVATQRIYDYLVEHLDELGIGGLGIYPANASRPMRIHIDIRPRLVGQACARWDG